MGQDRPAGAGRRHDHDPDHASGLVFGGLGDIHGAFDAARAIVAAHPEVPFWVCVGDLPDDHGRYESAGAPVYWIHGNNDDFEAIAAGDLPDGLIHIPNGTAIDIPRPEGRGPRVAGLGGTFAPKWYDTAPDDLPHTTRTARSAKGASSLKARDDKRRHFVRQEVEACKALSGIDILLTHEAARPFRAFPGGRGPDAGKTAINEVLAVMQPRLHLFGHHHRFTDEVREGVRSVGLDLVTRSYVLIDAASLAVDLRQIS